MGQQPVRRRRIVWAALALVGVILLALAFRPKPVPVDLAAVTRGPLRVTVDEDGKTRIKERYVVSSPLFGRLQRIELRPGAAIEAGRTVLAVIEPSLPDLLDERTRTAAQARALGAEAALKAARAKFPRARPARGCWSWATRPTWRSRLTCCPATRCGSRRARRSCWSTGAGMCHWWAGCD